MQVGQAQVGGWLHSMGLGSPPSQERQVGACCSHLNEKFQTWPHDLMSIRNQLCPLQELIETAMNFRMHGCRHSMRPLRLRLSPELWPRLEQYCYKVWPHIRGKGTTTLFVQQDGQSLTSGRFTQTWGELLVLAKQPFYFPPNRLRCVHCWLETQCIFRGASCTWALHIPHTCVLASVLQAHLC